MIRGLLRLLSMVALSVAVIAAVLDATRSIAVEAVVMTPLEKSWAGLFPATLEGFQAFVLTSLPDFVWTLVVAPVLRVPAFAVFGALALALYVAGHRPARAKGRFLLDH